MIVSACFLEEDKRNVSELIGSDRMPETAKKERKYGRFKITAEAKSQKRPD